MTGNSWLFLALILVGALALYTHMVLLYRVARSGRVPARLRLLPVLLPPLAPIFALWDGSRGMPLLWLLLGIAYGVLFYSQ